MEPYITFFINALIVGAGWYVVHWFSVRRELAKEKRSVADDVICKLEALEKKAKEYHMAEGRSIIAEREIKSNMRTVVRLLNRLEMSKTNEQRKRIARMRQSITSKNFESETFISCKENNEQIRDISIAISRLIMELENLLKYK